MKYSLDNGTLTLHVGGRVDASNADAVGTEIRDLCAANPHTSLILDMEELAYISSAGLRVVLKLRRGEKDMSIVNTSSEVYDIFEMTGFTEMIPVSKASRRLSVEGCEIIGRGANGTVYRLDPETIIKVYKSPECLPDIKRERELARKAFVLGVPTAIPYDVVRVGETYGSVFELLNARTLAQLIADDPAGIDTYIGMNVDLLKIIHSTSVGAGELPDARNEARKWVEYLNGRIPDDQYEKLHALFEAVPVNNHMMHGDYHIKNVLVQKGEPLLIDMDTLCVGDPVFELVGMYQAYVAYGETDPHYVEAFLGLDYATAGLVWKKTFAAYVGTQDESILRAQENKVKLLAYVRLLRRTIKHGEEDTPAGRETAARCRRMIAELLPQVSALQF